MHRRSQSLVFVLLLGLFAWAPSLLYGQTLEWDPNPEPDIDRYRVYQRTASESYTVGVDVGTSACSSSVCSYQPQGVDWSISNYFVVTAINTGQLESPFSVEAEWIPASVTTFTSLTADSSYPLVVETPVTWTAIATNNLDPVEYRFYLYRQTGWTMVRDYSTTNTWTWTPGSTDQGSPNYLQVWARAVGSTALFDAWLGTPAFEILPPPLVLSANVDFPTPSDNLVTWTAAATAATTTALEYQFRVMDVTTGNWSVFRGYAPNDQAQWTPGAPGSYVVEAWTRAVGSTAPFESVATTGTLSVQPTAVSVPALYVDTTFPAQAGKPMTWTAHPKGGISGPLQYQFWLYSPATGWKIAQPWGPSQSFTWTPTWGEEGTHYLQVWARNNGSTAPYEAWRATGAFTIDPADPHLTTSTIFPAPPGNPIQWTADVSDPASASEYQFWVYSAATNQWTLGQPYSPTNTFAWVPVTAGEYAVQVWVRLVGSGALLSESDLVQISLGAAHLTSLVSDVALPVAAGTTVTWAATASGGTGPIEYQFWRDDGTGWTLVQDYSQTNTYSWTTTTLDVGQHNLLVLAGSSGSPDESYMITGTFSILP
jgi:hypothetical protein